MHYIILKKKGIPSEYYFLKEIKKYIEIINALWNAKIKELLEISLLNIKEYLRYKYIQLNNKNKIKNLIESYFYTYDVNDPSKIFLCNGWIMNPESEDNLYPDITKYGSWYYLKRKVIIFKDTIKINYGKNIESGSNYLKNYMTKYISNLAMIFDGLYIDSIQYLPMFILKYFIDMARKIKPSIILLCNIPEIKNKSKNQNAILSKNEEKYSNQMQELKKKYVEELGINLFVYDIYWNKDMKILMNEIINNSSNYNNNIYNEIISHFNNNLYSSTVIEDNQVFLGKFKYLKPKSPFNIIYNINRENIFYYDKLKSYPRNLSTLSLIGLMDTSIGSIYEYDTLYPSIINKLKKMKKYKFNNDELKNLMQKIYNSKYDNEETLEVFFEFHPDIKKYNNLNYIHNVKLALNFRDWKPDIGLTKIKEDLFMTKIRLPLGKYYYKYVINDEIWGYDETQPIEKDNNGNINNVIDLRNHNKIIVPNIQLYRQELNKLNTFFKNKKSEIYVQKSDDLFCIIRVIADYNSLINKSIVDNDILDWKNKILCYEEKVEKNENNFSENDSDDEDYINQNKKNKIIKKTINFKFPPKSQLSKSLDKNFDQNKENNDNELSSSSGDIKLNNIYFPKKKGDLSSSPNDKKRKYSSPFKNREKINNLKLFPTNSNLLEASMDVNLGNSMSNINSQNALNNNLKNINTAINSNNNEYNENEYNDMSFYDGYAVVCFPTNKNNKLGKGEITIPGKISDLICACYMNEDNSINKPENMNINEIYFTKNINYLKSITSSINYYNDKTIIQFINIPSSMGLILKFKLGENNKNLIDNLNKNLEMLFNKGIEFINYFDLNDINKLLFETDKEVKDNKRRETYEININLYSDKINSLKRKNKIKYRYAGLNQLVEVIKMIKRTENLNLFENKIEELNENQKFIQSLYKDISSTDGLINYILARLSETKSFKEMYNFLKKLIVTDYKSLPSYIKPVYFEKIIISLHHAIMSFSLKE